MEQTTETPKRPGFLTTLCILSFIGTGLGIIFGVYKLATAGAEQKAAEMFGNMSTDLTKELTSKVDTSLVKDSTLSKVVDMGMSTANNMLGGMMESALLLVKYAYVLAAVAIITNILCLLGVMMMWRLRKSGYWIYLLGQVAALGIPIALVGFGGFFGGIMILMAIFPIAFIIMYGVNLKHMN